MLEAHVVDKMSIPECVDSCDGFELGDCSKVCTCFSDLGKGYSARGQDSNCVGVLREC